MVWFSLMSGIASTDFVCQDQPPMRAADRLFTADELVVVHPPVGQAHGTDGTDRHPCTARQPAPEYDGIQEIALQTDQGLHGTVVKGTGKRRHEVQASG